jgi:hypothetical protein
MNFSEETVRLVAGSFAYSFFWCGAVGIYLLLRKSVDQTEFDEVFLDDEEPPFDLPALQDGPSVVPEMVEKSESDTPQEEASAPGPSADESAATGEKPSPDGAGSDQDDDGKSGDDADDHDQELMF